MDLSSSCVGIDHRMVSVWAGVLWASCSHGKEKCEKTSETVREFSLWRRSVRWCWLLEKVMVVVVMMSMSMSERSGWLDGVKRRKKNYPLEVTASNLVFSPACLFSYGAFLQIVRTVWSRATLFKTPTVPWELSALRFSWVLLPDIFFFF